MVCGRKRIAGLSFLLTLAAQIGCSKASSDRIDVHAVVAEFDRAAATDLWPGFTPRTIPLAIFDGDSTYLFRHPSPPESFTRATASPADYAVMAGRHSEVNANTSVELNGVNTATMVLGTEGQLRSLRQVAALLAHEAFHVYQDLQHPDWAANEAELFTYPVDDAELLTLRRMETEALRRGLELDDHAVAACWAANAMSYRGLRFHKVSAGASGYERGNELKEGLAAYVQSRVVDSLVSPLPLPGFAPGDVRQRAYVTGAAMALLLDRLIPLWKLRLEDSTTALDELLFESVRDADRSLCGLVDRQRSQIRLQASHDISRLATERGARRDGYREREGWKVVVAATGEPLLLQGFDPLNVEVVGEGEVLHSRFLRLGNASGVLESTDKGALTEAVGDHPLFTGVRRALVTGIPEKPRVAADGSKVTLDAPGLSGEFRNARIEESEATIIVRLGSVER